MVKADIGKKITLRNRVHFFRICGLGNALLPAKILTMMSGQGLKTWTCCEAPGMNFMTDQATRNEDAPEALRKAEQRYRSIFEHCLEGIFQTTPEGKYICANPALARIYGYESADDLISALTDIKSQLYFEPGRRAEFIRLVREEGKVIDFESQVYRRDRGVIWISENARVVRD